MILILCGLGKGRRLDEIIHGYDTVHAFDANPEVIRIASKKYKKHKGINLHNFALGEAKGTVPFYVYSRNDSSSCGKISDNFINHWKGFKGENLQTEKVIDVECINLYEWCCQNNIDSIDYLATDLQGLDLMVLKTLEPMILRGNIKKIESEVEADDMVPSTYPDLPPCKFSDFACFFANKPYVQLTDFYKSWSWSSGVHRDMIWGLV